MERPIISTQTAFNPRIKRVQATFYHNKNTSRSNSKHSLSRTSSKSSLRSLRNTTTGFGPSSLNIS